MNSLSMCMLVLAGEKGFSPNDWLLCRRVMCVPYRKSVLQPQVRCSVILPRKRSQMDKHYIIVCKQIYLEVFWLMSAFCRLSDALFTADERRVADYHPLAMFQHKNPHKGEVAFICVLQKSFERKQKHS